MSFPRYCWLVGAALGLLGARVGFAEETPVATPAASAEPSIWSTFKDPEDGNFDASQFILSKHGFLAIPIVITEPAVGYGGGVALMFMKYAPEPPAGAPPPKRYVPPSFTVVAGGLTE